MAFLDLDIKLTDEDVAIKEAAHKFAAEIMRPIAKELDEMTPEEVVAPKSPMWKFLKKGYELGYHAFFLPDTFGGMGVSALQQMLIAEELSWGSSGLLVQIGVCCFPAFLGSMVPEEEIIEKFIAPYCQCKDASIRGCWGITEPDHGSDTLMAGYPSFHDPSIKANCRARLDGDEYVISGQKASWVSGGTIATQCALFCSVDQSMGHAGSGIFIVPLDLPGVSRGKPLNKMGQRDLNQGEVFFDEVRIPRSWCVVEPIAYEAMLEIVLSTTTAFMGAVGTGIARAAFEEALMYAKERVQGGKVLIDHTHIKMMLFNMLQRVEMARAMTRAAYEYNQNTSTPAEEYSIMAKIAGTEAACANTHDALMIFGGNGLSREYLIEKLYRDARATVIEDGSNHTLAIAAGHKIISTYPRIP